jgi:CubicO group peptidase (beta-lactamase class C family)
VKSHKRKKNLEFVLTFSLILLIIPFYILPISVRAANGGPYWPTNEWIIVDPEEQGMDSKSLADMYDFIEYYSLDVHSVIIIRNGYIVSEEYIYNTQVRTEKKYGSDYSGQVIFNRTAHVQYSTSKSVTSLLVGIALKEGYLSNINQTLFEFFSNIWNSSYNNKMNITIEQLLTHNSGLPNGGTPDPYIDNALGATLRFQPGTPGAFEYSNHGCNLLSAIINNATGYNASEYARIKIFEPIGISQEEWYWFGDSNNISSGAAGFMCTPRVQAKIGILSLNNGTWNGTQIIPSDWINEVSSYKIDGNWYYGWAPIFQYGYLFYVDGDGGYHTYGLGGQNIYIIPKYNVTVAFTGFDLDSNFNDPDQYHRHMIENFILQFVPESGPEGLIPGFPVAIIMLVAVVGICTYSKFVRKRIKIDRLSE